MKKYYLAVCFILLFSLWLSPVAAASDAFQSGAVETMTSVSAESYVLMDADTGYVLSEQNGNSRLPMASTTKVMTCLVALESGDLSTQVTVPKEAVGVEGSSVYLTEGEKLTLEELLFALMLESANDAAVAIAVHISGSVDAFVERMNEKASSIGLFDTHYENPHGLPQDGHYSSARDLSVLMCEALRNEAFAEISSTQTKTIPAPGGKNRFLSNHNRLLRNYDPCIAGKTGFTKEAGRCLVTVAMKDGKKLVCSTLGAPDDWNDHKELYQYGFSLYTVQNLAEAKALSFTVPVVGGVKDTVKVTNTESFSLSLRSDETVEKVLELPSFLYAGISSEEEIGYLVFLQNGKEVKRIPLITQESVLVKEIEIPFWKKIWIKICEWFN